MPAKKLVAFIVALGLAGSVYAQSGGSSAAGGGLSTKAILALEACFDDFDTFVCGPGAGETNVSVANPPGGTGTVVPKWDSASVLIDSNITDDGSDVTMPASLVITEDGTDPGIDLSDFGDVSFMDIAIEIGQTGEINWGSGTTGTFTYGQASGGGQSTQVWGALSGGNAMKFHFGAPGGATASIFSQAGRRQQDNVLSGANVTLEVSTQVTSVRGSPGTTVETFSFDGSNWNSVVGANTTTVTIMCGDSDVSFVDSDLAGPDFSLNLAGTATNFDCTEGDTLTLLYMDDYDGTIKTPIFHEVGRTSSDFTGGSGTTNTVTKWTSASTLGDSNITDDGADVTMPASLVITEDGTDPGIDLTDFGDFVPTDVGIALGDSGLVRWDGATFDLEIFGGGTAGTGSFFLRKSGGSNQIQIDFPPTGTGGAVLNVFSNRTTTLSGASIDLDVTSNYMTIAGSAGTSILRLRSVTGGSWNARSDGATLIFFCEDSDITFIDSDIGAEDEINLAGAATNFVCSPGDTLTLANSQAFQAGPNLWMEVSRSVN